MSGVPCWTQANDNNDVLLMRPLGTECPRRVLIVNCPLKRWIMLDACIVSFNYLFSFNFAHAFFPFLMVLQELLWNYRNKCDDYYVIQALFYRGDESAGPFKFIYLF